MVPNKPSVVIALKDLTNIPTQRGKIHSKPVQPRVQTVSHYERENFKLISAFGNAIFEECLESEKEVLKEDFTAPHPFKPVLRVKMVDWMVEVLNYFKRAEETFFLAVSLMDQFLWKTEAKVKDEELHLLGITCIFVSSKQVDLIPIKMKDIIKKVAFESFTSFSSN